MKNYGMILIEKPELSGLTLSEIRDMLDTLEEKQEVYPIEIGSLNGTHLRWDLSRASSRKH